MIQGNINVDIELKITNLIKPISQVSVTRLQWSEKFRFISYTSAVFILYFAKTMCKVKYRKCFESVTCLGQFDVKILRMGVKKIRNIDFNFQELFF